MAETKNRLTAEDNEICVTALLTTEQTTQRAAASTRGQTSARYGSCYQQRSQPAAQFPAHSLGFSARIHPCEADVNNPWEVSFQILF